MKEDLIAALVGITFFCVITIPLLFFTGYLDFGTDGGAEVPIPAPEPRVEYSEEMVYKELLNSGPEGYTIANQVDALVGIMRAQGIETDIVEGSAKHKSGNVWEVGATVISGGERYQYKWNYNIETKEIFPLTEMAKDLWYE